MSNNGLWRLVMVTGGYTRANDTGGSDDIFDGNW